MNGSIFASCGPVGADDEAVLLSPFAAQVPYQLLLAPKPTEYRFNLVAG